MSTGWRFGTTDDVGGLWELFRLAFGGKAEDRESWVSSLDPERALVVDGPRGEVAAASHIRPFRQWFGGEAVPMAGYSPVAVLPEHRGRGLGRAVTVAQYPDLRERGEVIAGLFPASLGLYRAVGFEAAGSYVLRRFPAADIGRIRPARAVDVRRAGTGDVDAIHRCYGSLARRRDGALARDAAWWARRLPRDLGDSIVYVVDDPTAGGEVVGYVIYRHGPARAPYDYSVQVAEVFADDPDVLKALWRVASSSGSQAPDLQVIGPAEDDLFLLTDHAAPEVVRSEIRWMLRLIDAPGAIAARGWPSTARGRVDLQIDDPSAPWNEGRWVLEVEGGGAKLVPGGAGTVEVTVGGLSSWWAGYASPARLARTGHLRSSDPSALTTMASLLPAEPPVLLDFF